MTNSFEAIPALNVSGHSAVEQRRSTFDSRIREHNDSLQIVKQATLAALSVNRLLLASYYSLKHFYLVTYQNLLSLCIFFVSYFAFVSESNTTGPRTARKIESRFSLGLKAARGCGLGVMP